MSEDVAELAHPAFPDITIAALSAELQREETQRKQFYPGRVEAARMSQSEMVHELAMIAALREDVSGMQRCWYTGNALDPATHGASWSDRRAAIARELELRHRVYPRQVEQARLSKNDASHRIQCFTALAWIFDDGFDWLASNGARPQFYIREPNKAVQQARREWDEHMARVMVARQPANQKELQL